MTQPNHARLRYIGQQERTVILSDGRELRLQPQAIVDLAERDERIAVHHPDLFREVK